jgi:hypothetical protein
MRFAAFNGDQMPIDSTLAELTELAIEVGHELVSTSESIGFAIAECSPRDRLPDPLDWLGASRPTSWFAYTRTSGDFFVVHWVVGSVSADVDEIVEATDLRLALARFLDVLRRS